MKAAHQALMMSRLTDTLPAETADHGLLNVVFVDGATMADLNESHLGHSGPTDVLTFDLRGEGPPVDHTEWVVAEVYVCLDVAVRAAVTYTTSVGYEVLLYAAHGMLHLAGEDDRNDRDRRRMRSAERRIMTCLQAAWPLEELFGY